MIFVSQSNKTKIMGVRKNAKFLSPTEKEDFVRACVLMKADIVNPGDPIADQYSKWDENVAIHWMIQNANAPGTSNVNFGHGGTGAYSFLSWHRYFLSYVESQLQTYVPGVMIPYWDWTDPSSLLVDDFLGPYGNGSNNNLVEQGYFAFDSPGNGANTTALPGWWPVGLDGWRLPDAFPSNLSGGLRRNTGTGSLPSTAAIQEALLINNYHDFQTAMEGGTGLAAANHNNMHNGVHGAIGGHMNTLESSPFDPIFFLHHCNIDRIWAMWQADGHATEYPAAGGDDEHHSADLMYPWVGVTAGYSTNNSINNDIPMPDFSALGSQTNASTLDFRAAYNYTYDTLPVMGISLDKTGSMNSLTPDPMVATDPDVTKWEAATRGVSLFLQDAETVQSSGAIYLTAGVQTFRSLLSNQFENVFTGDGYGLIKTGGTFSQASFDALIAAHSPGGGTPLVDALTNVKNTLVEPPFSGLPTDEKRYLAMLTDGIRTTGSTFATVPDGSLTRTAVFAMGFGTGADVDYLTLDQVVAKGSETLSTDQIFHGENVGVIDKFYTNSLAAAIGFTDIFDPLLELFAGEHSHIDFYMTSAEDAFFMTCQGMDFTDNNWQYMLIAPNGSILYGDHHHGSHDMGNHCHHCCPEPQVTAKQSKGRLSLMIQRNSANKSCWVGKWQLMVSYKAKDHASMVMPMLGELLYPVSAGPMRGNQFNRLLTKPQKRIPTRNIFSQSQNKLDFRAIGTNNNDKEACNVLINIYARTNININISSEKQTYKAGESINFKLLQSTNNGNISNLSSFARLIAPNVDLKNIFNRDELLEIIQKNERSRRPSKKYDTSILTAKKMKAYENHRIVNDMELKIKQGKEGLIIPSIDKTEISGTYHLGIMVDGYYQPNFMDMTEHCCGDHGKMPMKEPFSRLLNISVAVE